jgi:hypothetical protein
MASYSELKTKLSKIRSSHEPPSQKTKKLHDLADEVRGTATQLGEVASALILEGKEEQGFKMQQASRKILELNVEIRGLISELQ